MQALTSTVVRGAPRSGLAVLIHGLDPASSRVETAAGCTPGVRGQGPALDFEELI